MDSTKVSVPYRTPRERALAQLKQALINEGLAWLLIALGLLLAFMDAGSFSRGAMIGLGIALAKSLIQTGIGVVRHFQRAQAEDAAPTA